MKRIKPHHIKMALKSDVMNVEPSRDIWSEIERALPSSSNIHHAKRRISLAAVIIVVLVLSSSSLVLASTSYGKQAVDWVFQKFGIHLITKTPQLSEELKKNGAYTFIKGVPLKDNMNKVPSGMMLPSYLPESVAKSEAKIYEFEDGAGVRWSASDEQFIEVWYHFNAFGEGSKTITNGEPSNIQEVKIGTQSAMAFHDNNGWNISWAMDGHQYTVITRISLEEAVKVANSIK